MQSPIVHHSPWTWRGIEEGLPRLLELLGEEGAQATFFTTGGTVGARPGAVKAIVARGHELGCHGVSHNNFRTMDSVTARDEITRTNPILRANAPICECGIDGS